MSDLSDLPANTELATVVRFALTQWAEPKTTKLKQILFAFAAPAFAANGWLALAFAAVAAFAANGWLALASVAFATFAAFAANNWVALAAWAKAQDCGA